MRGLGDNIFQRPFVRAVATRRPVYLDTPWPQLYADLPVSFVRPATELRTQKKNRDRQDATVWTEPPAGAQVVSVGYGTRELRRGSIVNAMESRLSLHQTPFLFDLPPSVVPSPASGRYVVVRPVTLRREWTNAARNPRPEYVAQTAAWLRQAGFAVVLLADLKAGEEWAVGALPEHDAAYLHGELSLEQIIALVRGAAAVVGGVGWLVPMAIAAGVPLFCILGGQLGNNGPAKITDPRMDLSRVGWTFPDRPCHCEKMTHNCSKANSHLRRDFETWMNHAGPSL